MSIPKSNARRGLDRIRRVRSGEGGRTRDGEPVIRSGNVRGEVGWDHDARAEGEDEPGSDRQAALTARVISLFGEPAVTTITVVTAARALGEPRPDVQTALEALVQAGELYKVSEVGSRYAIAPERKAQLEAMFQEAAHELGETTALALREPDELMGFDDDEEPRLPVTAGLLSLFLPGTGQLLNGDVGRASLVFGVWSIALLTGLLPIWTFVALYAGAEAFFTAKVRGLERKMAVEAPGKKEPSTT
jgi:hypothetical protein